MSHPTIGKTLDGGHITVDVARLIETRALIQANSGGGKSWALRRLLEQTHGSIQQLVIDPEGEFYTLRERFDYVLAGKGGDCPADPRSAALLARRLLELGTSAILDLYELGPRDRVRFVRIFLESLIEAPRNLWHPALVVIDEAHQFAPEKGHGEAESGDAVAALMSKGRKRAFAGILATQRLSKLAKDVAAEANNLLIGRATLDVDLRRAGDVLGLAKGDWGRIQSLKAGHFFTVGPALSPRVVEVVVGGVETSHPRAGQGSVPPPPPRAKVQAVLAQLADLPKEAAAEAASLADARRKIASLERDLVAAKREQPAPVVERVEILVPDKVQTDRIVEACDRATVAGEKYAELLDAVTKLLDGMTAAIPKAPAPPGRRSEPITAARPVARRSTAAAEPNRDGLTGPEQRILDAIAWLESIGVDEPEQTAVAFVAGYSPRGGAFQNPRGRLNSRELIRYLPGGRLALTDEGRSLANLPDAAPTTEALHEHVLARLPGPERKLLSALLDAYPDALTNEELANATGYAAGGGAFQNPRGRLKTLGLVEYPERGSVRARSILFPHGAHR